MFLFLICVKGAHVALCYQMPVKAPNALQTNNFISFYWLKLSHFDDIIVLC